MQPKLSAQLCQYKHDTKIENLLKILDIKFFIIRLKNIDSAKVPKICCISLQPMFFG